MPPRDNEITNPLDARRKRGSDLQKSIAGKRHQWIQRNPYYYEQVSRLLRFIIQPAHSVLHVRCETAQLLSAVQPSLGVGVDTTQEMLEAAANEHPEYEYVHTTPDLPDFSEKMKGRKPFDYILFQGIDDTIDVHSAFKNLQPVCQHHTRLVIYTYNPLWEPLVKLAERSGMKVPELEQNWLSEADMKNMLELAGFDWLTTYRTVLAPKYIPLLSPFLNRFVAKLPWLNRLCMVQVLVARPVPPPRDPQQLSVSVIIPCKNERGNIEDAVKRIPGLGGSTELIFCDDKSTDGTREEILSVIEKYRDKDIKLVDGPGICKSKNVWAGFESASGDILMILDADLTTMPEELPMFLDAIASGRAEFANGSRLVYPMPRMAMKYTNMVGNKIFGMIFSCLLKQQVKDSLCGTKVIWQADWERFKSMIGTWGVEDKWGDYELLFGAAKLNLRIRDIAVHYQERLYGRTKMTRVFINGCNMLRMCIYGFIKLKLGY